MLSVLVAGPWLHAADAKDPDYRLLRLPRAITLQGYYSEYVVTPKQVIHLRHPSGWASFWTLSRDGALIAATICKSARCSVTNHTEQDVIATLTISTQQWTERGEFAHVGAVSISPDNSKLAFVNDKGLYVLDMKTGLDRVVASENINSWARPSWAPDGNTIVYQVNLEARDPLIDQYGSRIHAVDLRTGKIWNVVDDAQDPAWSPSGEWIAYVDTSGSPGGSKCMLVHPDGSGKQLAASAPRDFLGLRGLFGPRGDFWVAPVWSPDSKELLLSVYWDWETLQTDVYELNVAQRSLTRKVRHGAPVWAWAESN